MAHEDPVAFWFIFPSTTLAAVQGWFGKWSSLIVAVPCKPWETLWATLTVKEIADEILWVP